MTGEIATIGYEGAAPEAFDAALRRAGVDTVVDVRAVAVSRRKGFSKSALAERLRSQGVGYVHLRSLGDPKPGRDAARAGNFSLFRRIFGAHLRTPEAEQGLAELSALVASRRVALLCYEAEAANCHRLMVAAHIAKLQNLPIVHLRVVGGDRSGSVRAGASYNPGQGVAAA